MTDPARRHALLIGAHPDDCEIRGGGTAALWRRLGWRVTLLSLTDGGAGHASLPRAELVARRRREAEAAAAVIGAESRCLGIPDGEVEPTLAHRAALIRVLRQLAPDVILTHRPHDYHPDHRYTSQLVADASFLLAVPAVVPDTPPLRRSPAIFYVWDDFQNPAPFRPDVAIDIGPVMDAKLRQLAAHASQFFEWLPWLRGDTAPPPRDERESHDRVRQWLEQRHVPPVAEACRALLARRYGEARAATIRHAEAFERCEYGAAVGPEALAAIFPF